jgi:excisionase family DNA binding protein
MSPLVIIPAEELQAMLDAAILKAVRAALAENQTTATEEDGYLSVQKAADFADVHPDTIRAWIKTDRLRGYRAGRELRILRSELRRFLAADALSEHRETVEEEAAEIMARRR